jgi:hypothetical protein
MEELGIPYKGIVKVFQDKCTDGGGFAGGLLSAYMTIYAFKFCTAVQAILIRDATLFTL